MRSLIVASALGALMLSGCVSTSTTMLAAGTAGPATMPDSVVIYRTAAQVPGPYRELALLDSVGDANATNQSMMYRSMRSEAAKIGANGIILDSTTEPSAAAQVAGAIFGVGANRRGRAVAVLVEGQPTMLAPPKK